VKSTLKIRGKHNTEVLRLILARNCEQAPDSLAAVNHNHNIDKKQLLCYNESIGMFYLMGGRTIDPLLHN